MKSTNRFRNLSIIQLIWRRHYFYYSSNFKIFSLWQWISSSWMSRITNVVKGILTFFFLKIEMSILVIVNWWHKTYGLKAAGYFFNKAKIHISWLMTGCLATIQSYDLLEQESYYPVPMITTGHVTAFQALGNIAGFTAVCSFLQSCDCTLQWFCQNKNDLRFSAKPHHSEQWFHLMTCTFI